MRYVSRCVVKRNIFSADRKDPMLSDESRRWSGSMFQTIGPATENARRPNLLHLLVILCKLTLATVSRGFLNGADSKLHRWARGVHGHGDGGKPRNTRVSRRYGYECCGNTTGMDLTIAGFMQVWILLWRESCGNGRRVHVVFYRDHFSCVFVMYGFNFCLISWSKLVYFFAVYN